MVKLARANGRVASRTGVFVALLLPFAAGAGGCDDAEDPVEIPFEGRDVDLDPEKKKKKEPEPDESASADKPKPAPTMAQASKLANCCSALQTRALTAKDEGTKKESGQAASVCKNQIGLVLKGKISEATALATVRGSVLKGAPSACR